MKFEYEMKVFKWNKTFVTCFVSHWSTWMFYLLSLDIFLRFDGPHLLWVLVWSIDVSKRIERKVMIPAHWRHRLQKNINRQIPIDWLSHFHVQVKAFRFPWLEAENRPIKKNEYNAEK